MARHPLRLHPSKMSLSQARLQRPSLLSLGGRDGGGTESGAGLAEHQNYGSVLNSGL